MRVIEKKVYYCDFCGKHGLRSLAHHESRCTMNPDRECHWKSEGDSYRTYDKPHVRAGGLRPAIRWCKSLKRWNEANLEKLREKVDGCPACMLAVLRLAQPPGQGGFHWDDKGDLIFNYTREIERFNQQLQEEQYQADMDYERASMY